MNVQEYNRTMRKLRLTIWPEWFPTSGEPRSARIQTPKNVGQEADGDQPLKAALMRRTMAVSLRISSFASIPHLNSTIKTRIRSSDSTRPGNYGTTLLYSLTCSSFAKLFGRTRASDLAERTKGRSPLWPMLDDIARSFSRCSCRDQRPREVGCAVHPPTCTWMPHSEIPHIIVTPPGRQPPLLEPEVSSPASMYSESNSSMIGTPPLGPSIGAQVVGAVRADTTNNDWSWSGAELGHPATEPGYGHSLVYYPVALGTIVEEDDEHGSPSSPFVARAKSAIAMDRGAGCSSRRDLLDAFASPPAAIGRAEDDNDDDYGGCYYGVLSDYYAGVQEVEHAPRRTHLQHAQGPRPPTDCGSRISLVQRQVRRPRIQAYSRTPRFVTYSRGGAGCLLNSTLLAAL
ncbi:hypothetical protein BD413DRAFT_629591 [Trametes elegans]|nr:hypothetical protein BD413DRAFT_629591 [Trametes elegans]